MAEQAWIVAAPGNEAPYLLEWVAHYRALGFAGVVLFTSGSEDGTDRMAARLTELGYVRHVPLDLKEGRDPLRYGLRDVLPVLSELGADWAMAVDVDEYLSIRTDAGDLESLLTEIGPADAISVCRKPFGSGWRRGLPEGSVREAFTLCAEEDERGRMITRGIKTLFRPGKVNRLAPHRPYFDDGPGKVTWVDAGGQAMPSKFFEGQWAAHDGFSHRLARLHYYAVPSPEAFILRRGVPEKKNHRKALLDDWGKLDVNGAEDTAMEADIARAAPVLEALREDAALAELEQAGRAWHEARMAELLQDGKIAELCAEMTNATRAETKKAERKERKKDTVRTAPRGGGGTYIPPPVRPVRFDVQAVAEGESRAVLHGGFHKTATTYIQKLLEDNEAWLGGQSVYVVPHQKLRKHVTFPSQLDAFRQLKIHRRTKFSEDELQGFSEAFFAEPLALRPKRMILSDENIPGLPGHCVTSGALYQYRKTFFQCFAKRIPLPVTDAFFAVRNYADFFASSYVEYLRAATATTSRKMITPEEMRRNVLATLPSWQAVFADFAAVFPETRIHVWRFEDFRALRDEVLGLFCGDGVDVARLKDKKEAKTRQTASRRAVEEMVLISELEGAGAMSERSKEVQDRFPLNDENGRFDPWSAAERAHLNRLYERDWEAIRNDPRLSVLEP
ncbi:glycosyltransferase family 2 protein [Roseovarius indicus]|uniref:glycosyltransferase family 2 protein n=1 Tax=Roseovarius indicus TaxID=540747 RepID=UPI0032EAF1C4